MMNTMKARGGAMRLAELCYSSLLLAWFFLPLLPGVGGFFAPSLVGAQVGSGTALGLLLSAAAWIVPAAALCDLAAFLLERRLSLPPALAPGGSLRLAAGLLASAAVVATQLCHLFAFASSPSYFAAVGPFPLAVLALSVAYNAQAFARLLRRVGVDGESSAEVRAFKRERASSPEARRYAGIQRRLFLSFLSLIVAVIVVICALLLRDFSRTLASSIAASGESIVDRAASMAKSNPGDGKDHISREDYLRDEADKNSRSVFPFLCLSYYRYDSRSSSFVASESTLGSALGSSFSPGDLDLRETGWRESADGKRIDFYSPVRLSGKLLGFMYAEYDREVLYAPYFRTQTKVVVVALFFIYLSVFITYLLGRVIVMPLLFLNMSVNRLSQTLSGMVSGRTKIAAELLRYEDRIRTKDEIKGLSVEIGGMTSVIRGVVPYISASTLKAASREGLSTESRELAFLFTDIRGFTTLCEGRSPEEVVKLLNHYLELQSSLILGNGGDIDKFVGDEIMAMFEGPDKELKACRAGLAIREAMAREKELAKAAKRHVVTVGIGINAGPVVFGSVGAQNRMDFTSIGDTVNLAARLEGVNKEYGTKALVTEAVREKADSEFLCREIDLITVKGKTKPVRIYEILQARARAKAADLALAKAFEEGLAAYRARDWGRAAEFFSRLEAEYKDEASSVFLNRLSLFEKSPPPADWDGVFALRTK